MRKVRRYFAEIKQDIINALTPTAQREFDVLLERLLPLCADRERFKDAVLLFAKIGFTAEDIELLAEKIVKNRFQYLDGLHER